MTLSKHAGWKDGLKAFAGNPYAQAAAIPLIGAGMDAAVGHVRGMLSARKKTDAYKSMIEEQPMLKKHPAKRVQRYFNTLHRANPELARDPLVAGNWVATQIGQELPGTPHTGVVEGVRQVAQIRQMGRDPGSHRQGTFSSAAQNIAKTIPDIHRARFDDREKKFNQLKDGVYQELDKRKKGLENQAFSVGQDRMSLMEREQALADREKKALDAAALLAI